MRLGTEMVDAVLLHFLLEFGLAPPVGVLATVISQHLLRQPELRHGASIHLQHILRRLAVVQPQTDDKPRVVIDVPDQVGLLSCQTKRVDIRLPQLVGL